MSDMLRPRSGNGTRFFFTKFCRRYVKLSPGIASACIFLVLMLSSDISFSGWDPAHLVKLEAISARIDSLSEKVRILHEKFDALTPSKPYVIVNSTANELRLMSGRKVLRKAVCSTGSYILLRTYDGQEWLFKTPRGRFKVNVKLKGPWWYKPDWAYIEDGMPIPSPYSPKRYEPNVLGDFALGFGHGYLIHGTLYTRFLGMPITHGCVRLGDQDMQIVFQTMSHGNRIYVY